MIEEVKKVSCIIEWEYYVKYREKVFSKHFFLIKEILDKKGIEFDFRCSEYFKTFIRYVIKDSIDKFLLKRYGLEFPDFERILNKELPSVFKTLEEFFKLEETKELDEILRTNYENGKKFFKIPKLINFLNTIAIESESLLYTLQDLFVKNIKECNVYEELKDYCDLDSTVLINLIIKLDKINVISYSSERKKVGERLSENLYIIIELTNNRIVNIEGYSDHFKVEELIKGGSSHPHLNPGTDISTFCLGTAPVSNFLHQNFPRTEDEPSMYLYWGGFIEELFGYLQTESHIGVPYVWNSSLKMIREKVKKAIMAEKGINYSYEYRFLDEIIPNTYQSYINLGWELSTSKKLPELLGIRQFIDQMGSFYVYSSYYSPFNKGIRDILKKIFIKDMYHNNPILTEVTLDIINDILKSTVKTFLLIYPISVSVYNNTGLSLNTNLNLLYSRLSKCFVSSFKTALSPSSFKKYENKLKEKGFQNYSKDIKEMLHSRLMFIPSRIEEGEVQIMCLKLSREENSYNIYKETLENNSTRLNPIEFIFKGKKIKQTYETLEDVERELFGEEEKLKIDSEEIKTKSLESIDFIGMNPIFFTILIFFIKNVCTKSKQINIRA